MNDGPTEKNVFVLVKANKTTFVGKNYYSGNSLVFQWFRGVEAN